MNNIILVGFMGCGKSTTAKYISKRYGYKFVDTDKIIEKRQKMSIKEIFEKKGENYFRMLEREIIDTNLSFCDRCVISTGGGFVCHFNNMKKLKKIGWVFWLNISFEDIIKRIGNRENRPLLQDLDKAKKLYDIRIKYYKQAHFSIDANDSLENIAKNIISKISS